MKHTTVSTYRKDKYYPRVVKAFERILVRADVLSPSEILIEMGNLSKNNYEAWRKGQVPYLERMFEGNLSKANRILRIIGFHAHDLNMVPRQTAYHQWGKGKSRKLRFSKSGNPNMEKAYSRHYIWNQSQEKKWKLSVNVTRIEPASKADRRELLLVSAECVPGRLLTSLIIGPLRSPIIGQGCPCNTVDRFRAPRSTYQRR